MDLTVLPFIGKPLVTLHPFPVLVSSGVFCVTSINFHNFHVEVQVFREGQWYMRVPPASLVLPVLFIVRRPRPWSQP